MTYNPAEQGDIARIFAEGLAACTRDGGKKRAAGTKVPWYEDDSHEAAFLRHYARYKSGERVDPDSGRHPLWHASWRLAAMAATEERHSESDITDPHAEMYGADPAT